MLPHYNPSDPSDDLAIGSLEIRVHGRCHPWIDDPFDYDWLGATCSFAARHQCYNTFEAEELALLRQRLEAVLQENTPLSFVPTEQVFHLDIKATEGGMFEVRVAHVSEESESFMAVRADLEAWFDALSAILRAHPPRRELARLR